MALHHTKRNLWVVIIVFSASNLLYCFLVSGIFPHVQLDVVLSQAELQDHETVAKTLAVLQASQRPYLLLHGLNTLLLLSLVAYYGTMVIDTRHKTSV